MDCHEMSVSFSYLSEAVLALWTPSSFLTMAPDPIDIFMNSL